MTLVVTECIGWAPGKIMMGPIWSEHPSGLPSDPRPPFQLKSCFCFPDPIQWVVFFQNVPPTITKQWLFDILDNRPLWESDESWGSRLQTSEKKICISTFLYTLYNFKTRVQLWTPLPGLRVLGVGLASLSSSSQITLSSSTVKIPQSSILAPKGLANLIS